MSITRPPFTSPARLLVTLAAFLVVQLGSQQVHASEKRKTDEKSSQTAVVEPPLGLTVRQAIANYGPAARKILQVECERANVHYPPTALILIGLKKEQRLLLIANEAKPVLLQSYPLVSFSGTLGPKLKEGDLQIPEGSYRITNLAASFRLALAVDYPNETDRKHAAIDHRTNLGGSILVHGGSVSTGCLVISNDDMKQIFTAVYDVGCSNTKLLIAPCNLLTDEPGLDMKKQPKWLPDLYKELTSKFKEYLHSPAS